jgi:pilus assembly protein FimV
MGMGVSNRLPIASSIVLATILALLAGPAAALGLGQIQVKSQPGQPLLAEIPIISSDPAELQGLEVRLAPPETFERVGLQPPTDDVSTLHFEPALDARGNPVIRVTSAVALHQPLLTFLVEVNSNGIRLVREVSALLDAPRTVAAPMQPPIQAPAVAPSNTIVRPVEAPVATAPLPRPMPAPPPTRVPPPIPAPIPTPVVPAPTPAPVTAIPPSPAAIPAPVAVAAAASTVAPPAEYGPVRQGQTLSQIAGQLDTAPGYSLDQTMLALLRTNPDAFIGDDINRLKKGAVLRVPQAEELSRYSASQAAAVVREQVANWREARRPTPQPAAVADAPATPAASSSTSPSPRINQPAPRVTDARLEIVPPSASNGRRAGTRSGIDAGGEGDMLRQQLQETKETLAARDAEVQELKTRVADLEKLQQQQQQLLTMKNSELAAAQQNLAKTNQAAAAPAAQAHQPVPASPEPAGRAPIWLWGGIALIAMALLGWWLSSRRRSAPPAPRLFDTAALAASVPTTEVDVADDGVADDGVYAVHAVEGDEDAMTPEPAGTPVSAVSAAWGGISTAEPTWHAGPAVTTAPVAVEAINASQQLELARAYLDMGDDSAARELLRDVLDGRDPAARAEAARLLRDL